MELSFEDEPTRELYCRSTLLTRRHGRALADAIACRLSLLSAAPRLGDVPMQPPIALTAHGDGLHSVALGLGHRLRFRVAGSAMVDAEAVTSIVILGLAGADGPTQQAGGTE